MEMPCTGSSNTGGPRGGACMEMPCTCVSSTTDSLDEICGSRRIEEEVFQNEEVFQKQMDCGG